MSLLSSPFFLDVLQSAPLTWKWYEYVGYFGSFLTSITFVPQVYKAWQTKSVGDLSRWTVLIVIFSASVWLTYGIAIFNGPVIIANSVVLVSSLILLYFTFAFKPRPR